MIHAKAANRQLHLQMGKQHPTLWTFIKNLRKVQSRLDTFCQQLEARKSPTKMIKKCIDVDKIIFSIVEHYNNRIILSFKSQLHFIHSNFFIIYYI